MQIKSTYGTLKAKKHPLKHAVPTRMSKRLCGCVEFHLMHAAYVFFHFQPATTIM